MSRHFSPSGLVNRFRISFSDGSPEVEIQNSIGDVIAWERENKKMFTDNAGIQSMLWVAFRAAKRAGLVNDTTFDEFVVRVGDLLIEVNDDAEDPTQ